MRSLNPLRRTPTLLVSPTVSRSNQRVACVFLTGLKAIPVRIHPLASFFFFPSFPVRRFYCQLPGGGPMPCNAMQQRIKRKERAVGSIYFWHRLNKTWTQLGFLAVAVAIAVRLVTVGRTAHRNPSTNISLLGTPLPADDDFREHVTLLHVGFFVAFGERVGQSVGYYWLSSRSSYYCRLRSRSFLPPRSFVRLIYQENKKELIVAQPK